MSKEFDAIEEELRTRFKEQEHEWDVQDTNRIQLLAGHKAAMLKRLELMEKSGQQYSDVQVHNAVSAPTSQLALPPMVRRSYRNGEYYCHGKNCSIQEMRHANCKISCRNFDDSVELTRSWHDASEPKPRSSAKLKKTRGIAGIPLNVLNYFRDKAGVPPSQDTSHMNLFNTVISQKDFRLDKEPKSQMEDYVAKGSPKIALLAGLATKAFAPEDLTALVEYEKRTGNGRLLEKAIGVPTCTEEGNFSLAKSPNLLKIYRREALPGVAAQRLSDVKLSVDEALARRGNADIATLTHSNTFKQNLTNTRSYILRNAHIDPVAPDGCMPDSAADAALPSGGPKDGALALDQSGSVSLPTVLRANRIANRIEPINLSTIKPSLYISSQRVQKRANRVNFAPPGALFKLGNNDRRIENSDNDDSDQMSTEYPPGFSDTFLDNMRIPGHCVCEDTTISRKAKETLRLISEFEKRHMLSSHH